MKLKFKVQPYQTTAVESVIDCFAGQVNSAGVTYRVDPGRGKQIAPLGICKLCQNPLASGMPLAN